MGGKLTRGFKPRFGQVRQVREVQGATVVDDKGKEHLTKFVLPVSETTNDAGPRRIEQKGSQLTDATRRKRLQPYANELTASSRQGSHNSNCQQTSKDTAGFHSGYGKRTQLWGLHSSFRFFNLDDRVSHIQCRWCKQGAFGWHRIEVA